MKTVTLAIHSIMKIAFFIGFLFCYSCESKELEPLEPSQTNLGGNAVMGYSIIPQNFIIKDGKVVDKAWEKLTIQIIY